ncbi:unnamed protein product, partial [Soboliphyme baturini]|uniref:DOMON domain-containing protein n=1 Tax=Soboliphyme baturini TaxID=241478 RepID=A0A183J4R6_9BILA
PIVGDVCYGEWHYPPGCTDCQFRATWAYIDEIDSIEFTIAASVPEESWTGIGFSSNTKAWHLANKIDMIVVQSHKNQLTVTDMNVASPLSVPKLDPEQNLVLPEVVGMHENGMLRATFIRPRTTTDLINDVQFTDEDCFNFVFPAHPGRLDRNGNIDSLTKPPIISKEKVCVRSCTPKIFKKNCQQEYRFPAGCIPPSCEYLAVWSFDPSSNEVTFHITSKEVGRWTGIGFSETGSMTNSDMIMGWVHENKTYVTDRFAYGKEMPVIDKQKDVYNIQGRIEDGMQTLVFSRKRNTTDTQEDVSLDECVYFLFPVGGGRILARSSQDYHDSSIHVGFHDMYIPKVSSEPICICS